MNEQRMLKEASQRAMPVHYSVSLAGKESIYYAQQKAARNLLRLKTHSVSTRDREQRIITHQLRKRKKKKEKTERETDRLLVSLFLILKVRVKELRARLK